MNCFEALDWLKCCLRDVSRTDDDMTDETNEAASSTVCTRSKEGTANPPVLIVQVSETTIKYVIDGEKISHNIHEEAQLFNSIKRELAGIDIVRKIEIYKCATTLQSYETKRRQLLDECKDVSEVWVFHGTVDSNIQKIMLQGFKVGGLEPGITVRNGSSFGFGVYTSRLPGLPITYTRGIRKLILAKGMLLTVELLFISVLNLYEFSMEGMLGNFGTVNDPSSDSWTGAVPFNDVIVFRDGRQLLPVYVIHH